MRVWMWPARFERVADRADAAVHHVRRRDDVGAGLGVRQRLLDQRLDGLVVDHVAGVVDQAVLAVRGVRIERDVGDHAELGKALPSARAPRAARGRRDSTLRARRALFAVGRRDREQRQRRDAERMRFAGDASAARRSTARSTPGIDGTGSRCASALDARTPAWIRSSAVKVVSRASARARSRRGACGACGWRGSSWRDLVGRYPTILRRRAARPSRSDILPRFARRAAGGCRGTFRAVRTAKHWTNRRDVGRLGASRRQEVT